MKKIETLLLCALCLPLLAWQQGPVCDEHTVISLTNDDPLEHGLTKVPAHILADGSSGPCGQVTFDARRMTSCIDFDWTTNGAGLDETPNGIVDSRDQGQVFREYIPFACCDVGAGPIMVELRVTDACGLANTCMVEVTVQDDLAPQVTCPPDAVVSCDFWFHAVETGGFIPQQQDPLSPVFGRTLDAYQFVQSDRQPVIIDDPGRPTNTSDPDYLQQPHNWGLEGWANDNCDAEITVRVRVFTDCSGEDFPVAPPHTETVKLVERTFRARDAQGNSTTCLQRIWVVDFKPFYIVDQSCVNADPNDGIIWPCDEEYATCPEELPTSYPTILEDNCSLVAVTYEDQRFDFVDDACYKILRTWSVIDWCQYDLNTGYGKWEYTQVIKVLDNDGARFSACPEEPVTLCVDNPNVWLPDNNQVFVGEGNPDATYCSAHVRLEHVVTETCSDWVEYDVKVYPGNGSDYLQVVDKTRVTMDTANEATLVFNTVASALLEVRQNGLPYNDRNCLDAGGPRDYHRILWTVEDGCGNLSICAYLFRLEDCKQPSPVCKDLTTVLMPEGGEVTIWARDFDASSLDDCTSAKDLLYSFSGEDYVPSRTYNCDSVLVNSELVAFFPIELWTADTGTDQNCDGVINWDERNKDYCSTLIRVEINDPDNSDCLIPHEGTGVLQTEGRKRITDRQEDNTSVSYRGVRRQSNAPINAGPELYQNTPNPFTRATVIGFELHKTMQITLTVFDLTGKVIWETVDGFDHGYHEIRLSNDDLNATGVLYYRLQAGQISVDRKMVVLD